MRLAVGGSRYSPFVIIQNGMTSGRAAARKTLRTCHQCGSTFLATLYDVAHGRGLYCSRKCTARSRTGARNAGWRGGVRRAPDGRIIALVPDHPRANNKGYVFRAILVMERLLGRHLLTNEHVHHLNGVVDDDRQENLAVMEASAHLRMHRLAKPNPRDPVTGRFLAAQ